MRPGKFVALAAEGPMFDQPLLRLERCGHCAKLFPICRRCYRGHAYCSEPCREAARAAQVRAARAAHRQSAAGRADHRDHNRALRLRKRAGDTTPVSDQGSAEVALAGSVCPPQVPRASMSDAPAARGRSPDVAATLALLFTTPTVVLVDVVRSPAPITCCAVCARPGVVVSRWPSRRRPRHRRDGPRQSRHRVGRGGPRPTA